MDFRKQQHNLKRPACGALRPAHYEQGNKRIQVDRNEGEKGILTRNSVHFIQARVDILVALAYERCKSLYVLGVWLLAVS